LSINEARGFLGMIRSIDCMHWEGKNCIVSMARAIRGHAEGCTVILEVVASQDLWIWTSFFSMVGSHNDINMLQWSPVFARLAEGNNLLVHYEINGHPYKKCYYLADGIYPIGLLLCRKFVNQRRKKLGGLPNNGRYAGRLWSVHLVCSNLGGLLFDTLLGHGAHRWCGR
jgi:hypothetical protein